MKPKILIAEDEPDILHMIEDIFSKKGYISQTAPNGRLAFDKISDFEPDIVLSDIQMPVMDGMQLLKNMTKTFPEVPIVLMTGHGTVQTAVEAMKLGAKDYILKPLRLDEIVAKVERLLQMRSLIKENEYLLDKLQEKYDFTNMIGKTDKIRKLFNLVKDVAGTNTTILIQGDSGTGKELIANAIHYNSQRAKRPFVKINCGVLAENLLESELFGHVRGAFTGAIKDKVGRFELANGGSLFLDEIGDISLNMQLKLLRVLQEGEFERVGGTETLKVDVRIIAATNKDLEKAMKEGSFRQDLFYRLNVIPIYVPPLRERREDIKFLILHFVDKFGKIYGKQIKKIDPQAMKVLEAYDYPGNIRELENLIERIIVLNKNNEITMTDLPESIYDNMDSFSTEDFDFKEGLQTLVERFERKAILKALEMNNNNKVQTAKMLAMNRSTFMSKLKKYSIS